MQSPIYRECMRNHAAKLGSYATDGCREYSPSSSAAGAAPDLCAACGCHRSYHRRIDLEPVIKTRACLPHASLRRVKQLARQIQQREPEQHPPAVPVAAEEEEEEEEEAETEEEEEEEGNRRRRQRRRKSKFTAEQREAMRDYAERLGWTLRDKRGRREEIRMFCDAIGVSRYLFKTWVNNNKRFYSVS